MMCAAIGAGIPSPDDAPPTLSTAQGAPPVVTVVEVVAPDPSTMNTQTRVQRMVEDGPDWPSDHRGRFLTELAPHAVMSGVNHCVPPSVVMAQAIQESGWGRSGLAKRYGNLFGIKDFGGGGVELKTTEGQGERTRARFRTWDHWSQSIEAHGQILGEDPRYDHAKIHREDGVSYARAIGPVYATDPKYSLKLERLIRRYQLDAWDQPVARMTSC
jgi:flagellum-specific peptidoglycan hydrolase FlgJ